MEPKDTYFILEYVSRTIIGPLTTAETCVTLKVLMQMKNVGFDILCTQTKEIVTQFFIQQEDGKWVFDIPQGAK